MWQFWDMTEFARMKRHTLKDLQWRDSLYHRDDRPLQPLQPMLHYLGMAKIRHERSAIFTEAGAAKANVSPVQVKWAEPITSNSVQIPNSRP
jgi:hypothetical protein